MFAFVLTGEDGSRRFGYCRRLLVNNSPINERTATGQEVAEYHNDSWVNKRAKIVSVPVGKQCISESERKWGWESGCLKMGVQAFYVHLFILKTALLNASFPCFSRAEKANASLKSTVSSVTWAVLTFSPR